ncbi:thioesterase-like superfamily-domain-containing protein [Phascolomyces articulosus]|uniref:Thioesterase-like superfamily-domain-containing protein n=1 Tax=Phascolomyces articulosus TaxID=60185 RepID=A0AAD5K5W5_9FUNG|nr:thioesterase-like superfamily-domain-containing protein [Phascolomyces articulosus]
MPVPSTEFDQVTDITFLGKKSPDCSIFSCQINKHWAWFGVPLGGYLTSAMLKAAIHCYPERTPAALTSWILRVSRSGLCIIEVKDLKISKQTFSTVTVTLQQPKEQNKSNEKLSSNYPIRINEYNPEEYQENCHAIITLTGPNHVEQGPTIIHPNARSPPNLDYMEPVDVFPKDEQRFIILQDMTQLKGGESLAECHHAFEFLDNRPIDAFAVTFFADLYRYPLHMLPEKQDQVGYETTWKPTLQYEIQFKNPIPPNTTQVLATFWIPHLISGRFDMDGELYTPNGKLLATTRHHGIVIPRNTRQGLTAKKPTWQDGLPRSSKM